MKIMEIYPVFSLVALFFVLFFLYGDSPHSLEAYYSPYTGEFSYISTALLVIGILDLLFLNFIMIPKLLQTPKSRPVVLVTSVVFAFFGFAIGVLNQNPWAALPFFAVAFGNYILVYTKTAEK